jgi:hypothetical protein
MTTIFLPDTYPIAHPIARTSEALLVPYSLEISTQREPTNTQFRVLPKQRQEAAP